MHGNLPACKWRRLFAADLWIKNKLLHNCTKNCRLLKGSRNGTILYVLHHLLLVVYSNNVYIVHLFRDIITIRMYVTKLTACDLKKSFIFDKAIKIIGYVYSFRFVYGHIANTCYIFQNSWSYLQGHSRLFIIVHSVDNIWFPVIVFNCKRDVPLTTQKIVIEIDIRCSTMQKISRANVSRDSQWRRSNALFTKRNGWTYM